MSRLKVSTLARDLAQEYIHAASCETVRITIAVAAASTWQRSVLTTLVTPAPFCYSGSQSRVQGILLTGNMRPPFFR